MGQLHGSSALTAGATNLDVQNITLLEPVPEHYKGVPDCDPHNPYSSKGCAIDACEKSPACGGKYAGNCQASAKCRDQVTGKLVSGWCWCCMHCEEYATGPNGEMEFPLLKD